MKRWLFLLLATLSAVAITLTASGCRPTEFKGTEMPQVQAPDFTLTAANGEQVSLSDFRDRIVLLYFGYTFCPDVCPATMAQLGQVQRQVDDEADEVQVIMVSVDPQRDTPAIVSEYAAHFHPSFIGLSGTAAEIEVVAQDHGIYYDYPQGTDSASYLVDHTARVFVIDRDGNYRLSYPFDTPGEDIVSDLRLLLQE